MVDLNILWGKLSDPMPEVTGPPSANLVSNPKPKPLGVLPA
jgi:hypothetical protein